MCKREVRASPEQIGVLYRTIKSLGVDLVAESETVSSLNEIYFPEWNPTYK